MKVEKEPVLRSPDAGLAVDGELPPPVLLTRHWRVDPPPRYDQRFVFRYDDGRQITSVIRVDNVAQISYDHRRQPPTVPAAR